MRVLMVSQWYAPEPETRVSTLAEALAEGGHQVTVLTGFPNYPTGKLYDGYRITWRSREQRNGVALIRLALFPDHSRSAVKRVLNHASFAASLFAFGTFLTGPTDVVWAYTVGVGPEALWFGKVLHAPVVVDVPDLWPDTLSDTGMLRKGLVTRAVGVGSKAVYHCANVVTVWNPGFKRVLVGRGVPARKIEVIENWTDAELFRPMEKDQALAAQYGMAGKFNVVFAGNIGFAQHLETVVDAARRLLAYPDIQFVIVGDGSCHADTMHYSKSIGATNVTFLGRHPQEAMPALFALADALLVHLRKTPSYEMLVPAKTHTYLACAKPIIMAMGGDAAELVESNECGLTCPSEDPDALAEVVRKLHQMTEAERGAMGAKGRRLFEDRFAKSVLLKKMVGHLTTLAGERQPTRGKSALRDEVRV